MSEPLSPDRADLCFDCDERAVSWCDQPAAPTIKVCRTHYDERCAVMERDAVDPRQRWELLAECRRLSSQVGELNRQRDFEWERRKTAETAAAHLSSEYKRIGNDMVQMAALVARLEWECEDLRRRLSLSDAVCHALVSESAGGGDDSEWMLRLRSCRDAWKAAATPSPEGTE